MPSWRPSDAASQSDLIVALPPVPPSSSPLRDLGTSGLSDLLDSLSRDPLGQASTQQLDGYLASLVSGEPPVAGPSDDVVPSSSVAVASVDPVDTGISVPDPPAPSEPSENAPPAVGSPASVHGEQSVTSDFRDSVVASSSDPEVPEAPVLPGN